MGETTQSVLHQFQKDAKEGKEVEIEIYHSIVNQFSTSLYDNPRRAIEELVCNSYDAYATECYVSTPKEENDVLQVLDNGLSMNESGLDQLWDIAGGPKQQAAKEGKERKIKGRKQIGRFGVGKLAAFAMGNELTYVATTDGTTRIISVSRKQIEEEEKDGTPSSTIYEMNEEEAKAYLGEYLSSIPDPWSQGWDSWTLAIVDDVAPENTGRSLKAEHLDKMIRTAIPLSANFTVHRNGKKVSDREYPDVKVDMNAATNEEYQSKLETELKSFWAEREDSDYEGIGDVPPKLYKISSTKLKPYDDAGEKRLQGIHVPKLGDVYADGAIYEDTLTPDKLESQDIYDHGFKLRVRGKLVNRTEPLFGISQRSHSYWNSFRGEFEIPNLDDEILVQRNDLQDGVKKDLAKLLLKSFFNALRNDAEEEEEKREPESFGHRLHTLSPYKAAEALQGLSGGEDEYPENGWQDVDVKLAELGRGANAVRYEKSDETIYVNDEHPLFEALEEKKNLPSDLRKVIGEALAGSEIAKGYLQYYDVRKELVDDTKEITEQALEIAAGYINNPFKYFKDDLEDKSHEGDDAFEESISDALNFIGAETEHYGDSGDSDAIVTFPIPDQDAYKISIEAKGKEEVAVSHQQVNISTAREHMDDDECDHTLIVAREFTLDGPKGGADDSKLLKQLRMHDDVSAMTVESLQVLLDKHQERPIPHPQLKEILTHQKDPNEVSEYITQVHNSLPAEKEIVKEVLETAYQIQKDDTRSQRVGLIMAEVEIEDSEIETILKSAQISTSGMVTLRDDGRYFSIHQKPEQVIKVMSGTAS
jgi:hypothetical protein